MKKFLFVMFTILIGLIQSYAEVSKDQLVEIKILRKLAKDITGKTFPNVSIYSSKNYFEIFKKYSNLNIVKNFNKADIIIVLNIPKKLPNNKPIFAVGYLTFKNCKPCIGGLYWKKGRPQLILIKERLQYFKINIPKEYRFYIISINELERW